MLQQSLIFISSLFFVVHNAAWRFSIPQPGIEPRPWQWKTRILTNRPPGKFLFINFYWFQLIQWIGLFLLTFSTILSSVLLIFWGKIFLFKFTEHFWSGNMICQILEMCRLWFRTFIKNLLNTWKNMYILHIVSILYTSSFSLCKFYICLLYTCLVHA